MRILYLYPFCGELGWELHNWVPAARYKWQQKGAFDQVRADVRVGHEGIYRDFVDTFSTFDHFGKFTEGNAFVTTKPEAYDWYKERCRHHDRQVEKLRKAGNEVEVFRLPKSYYRYHRYKRRHCAYVPLVPDKLGLEKWSSRIEPNAVIFHLRHISRSKKKNTPPKLYNATVAWCQKHQRQLVTVGHTAGYNPKFRIENDLLNKTTLDDLIAVFALGGMVVGSSSGPLHLAALTRTPHVVWGGERSDVRARYLDKWNPLKTPCDHISLKFACSKDALLRALTRMSDRPEAVATQRRSKK